MIMQAESLGCDASGKKEWDQFVQLSPHGSIFATTTYLDALGARYDLVVARKDGVIDVGIPLVRNSLGFRTNPLFCKYLGVLSGPTRSSKQSLVASRLYERIDALGPAPFNISTFDYLFHPRFDNWMPFYWRKFSQQTQYTFWILPSERDTWWDKAETRLRNSVKSGARDGIVVQRLVEISTDMIGKAYGLCSNVYQRRGARPPISLRRFARLVEQLSATGNLGLWIARDRSEAEVACAVALYDWHSAYLLMTGTAADVSSGAGALLIKTMIDATLADGIIFDFEGSMIQSIERFYRSFGGHRVPYFRIWKPTAANAVKHCMVRMARTLGKYNR